MGPGALIGALVIVASPSELEQYAEGLPAALEAQVEGFERLDVVDASSFARKWEAALRLACTSTAAHGCEGAGTLVEYARHAAPEGAVRAYLVAGLVLFEVAREIFEVPEPEGLTEAQVQGFIDEKYILSDAAERRSVPLFEAALDVALEHAVYGPELLAVHKYLLGHSSAQPYPPLIPALEFLDPSEATPSTPAQARAVLTMLRAGDSRGGHLALEAALKARPDDAWTVYNLAMLALRHRDYVRGERLLARAYSTLGARAELLEGRAFARMGLGDYEGAIPMLEVAYAQTRAVSLLVQLVFAALENVDERAVEYCRAYAEVAGECDFGPCCGHGGPLIRLQLEMAREAQKNSP